MRSETLAWGGSAYGGFIDALGGIATIVLAVLGLGHTAPEMMVAIATIVFGVALLVQGGTILSENASVIFPPDAYMASAGQFGTGSLSVVFLAGAAGIILGVLALLAVIPGTLSAAPIITFGAALVLSSNSVWQLQVHKRTASVSGGEAPGRVLANEIALGSAGVQTLSGLAAIVLGILALAGSNAIVLTLVALLALGGALILTGSTLSTTVLSFMRPSGAVGSRTATPPA